MTDYVPHQTTSTPSPSPCPSFYEVVNGATVCYTATPTTPPEATTLPPTGDPLLPLWWTLALVGAATVAVGTDLRRRTRR